MKRKLLILCAAALILGTACSAAGTSSGTSQAPVSSKVEVSSKAGTSSRATSSSKYAPSVDYLNYEDYFSMNREIDLSGWGKYQNGIDSPEGPHFQKDGVFFLPYASAYGTFAETETGLLLLNDGKVYEAHEPGKSARLVYAPNAPYVVTRLYKEADAHIFYAELRNQSDPSKFQVCRFFRYAGIADIVATEADVPGNLTELDIWSNSRLCVISHVPYEIPKDCDPDEAINIADRARRCTFIDTIRGVKVCDDDEAAYQKAMDELTEIKKRERAEATSAK